MIAGVDEAGRGPVLGPLVVAGVALPDDEPLRELGVRDSKKLTPARRETLAVEIRRLARVEVVAVQPGDLDARMARRNLNGVEVDLFAEVLGRLGAPRAWVDACDVVEARFGAEVRARVPHACEIVAEHGADDRYAIVGAASVVAKVERDAAIRRISAEIGRNVGSGYAHDPVTQRFLREWVAERGALPPCARGSWETSRRALARNRSLMEFNGE